MKQKWLVLFAVLALLNSIVAVNFARASGDNLFGGDDREFKSDASESTYAMSSAFQAGLTSGQRILLAVKYTGLHQEGLPGESWRLVMVEAEMGFAGAGKVAMDAPTRITSYRIRFAPVGWIKTFDEVRGVMSNQGMVSFLDTELSRDYYFDGLDEGAGPAPGRILVRAVGGSLTLGGVGGGVDFFAGGTVLGALFSRTVSIPKEGVAPVAPVGIYIFGMKMGFVKHINLNESVILDLTPVSGEMEMSFAKASILNGDVFSKVALGIKTSSLQLTGFFRGGVRVRTPADGDTLGDFYLQTGAELKW